MKWISLAIAALLLLSACNRSVPTVTAPTTTGTTTSTRHNSTSSATVTTTAPSSSYTTAAAEDTPATTKTTTTTTTSVATTTTTVHRDATLTAIQEIAYLAKALGPFDSVDELSAQKVAEALYVYGTVATDDFAPYTAFTPPTKTVRLPIETADTLCRRFFGRTYAMDSLSFSMSEEAVQVDFADKALTFTVLSGYGIDNEFICTTYKTSGQQIAATVYDAVPVPAGLTGDYTEIAGKYYEIRGIYTLTLIRNGEYLQLISLIPTE